MIEWREAVESLDSSSISDVFNIEDLSEFSHEDIVGPIPSHSLSSSLSAKSSQNMAKHIIFTFLPNKKDLIFPPVSVGDNASTTTTCFGLCLLRVVKTC